MSKYVGKAVKAGQTTINNYPQAIIETIELYLREAIIASIEYEGLPENIQKWDIERLLFDQGQVAFIEMGGEYFVLPVVGQSFYGAYARIDEFKVITILQKQIQKTFKNYKNGVVIMNNVDGIGTMSFLKPFTLRLEAILNNASVNLHLSNVFAALFSSNDNKNTIKKQWEAFITSPNGLFVSESKTMLKSLKESVFTFNVAYSPEKFWLDYDKTFNEMIKMLGIEYDDNPEKRERETEDEIHKSDAFTVKVSNRFIQTRQYAIDQINKIFGLNIKIKIVGSSSDEEKEKEIEKDEKE